MINYTWDCKTVDVRPVEDSLTDVVYNVHWKLTGVKEDWAYTSIGTQWLGLDSESEFIPFDELTEEIIEAWVISAMGEEEVEAIKAGIAAQLEEKENPTSVTKTIGE